MFITVCFIVISRMMFVFGGILPTQLSFSDYGNVHCVYIKHCKNVLIEHKNLTFFGCVYTFLVHINDRLHNCIEKSDIHSFTKY